MNWCIYCGRKIGDNSRRCRACQYLERTQTTDPTPDDIRRECEAIQAGWGDVEKARRERDSGLVTGAVEVTLVHEDQVQESATEAGDAARPPPETR